MPFYILEGNLATICVLPGTQCTINRKGPDWLQGESTIVVMNRNQGTRYKHLYGTVFTKRTPGKTLPLKTRKVDGMTGSKPPSSTPQYQSVVIWDFWNQCVCGKNNGPYSA